MRKQNGFSLIELLIVIAIILIIAAIAIPNLIRARMAANDSSAAGSIHQINNGEAGYYAAYEGVIGFPATLLPLGGTDPCTPTPAAACLIDNNLATNGGGSGKSGFNFAATGTPVAGSTTNDQFYATGTPFNSASGSRAYCSTEDMVVRLQPAGNTALVSSYSQCLALSPMNN